MADAGSLDHPVPPALTAFLRGVERRAALFAELQCGDAAQGDLAVAQTLRAFHADALALPLADWPRRFWQRLSLSPALRTGAGARWPETMAHLGALEAGDRRALLSRLAAALPEDEAVEVLGVDLLHYRAALAAACPRDASGEPDAAGWRVLAETIQSHGRQLPDERMARLARLRSHALAPPAETVAAAPLLRTTPPPSHRVWGKWMLIAVVILCLLALAATWFWPSASQPIIKSGSQAGEGLGPREVVSIQVEPLGTVDEPVARLSSEELLATHPDLDLLRDPEAMTVAQEAALLAWYLAGTPLATPAEHAETDVEAVSTEEGRDATF